MRKQVLALVVGLTVAGEAHAQPISAEADKWLWCRAILDELNVLGTYPSLSFVESVNATLAYPDVKRAADAALAAMGLDPQGQAELLQSYADEARVQGADFRVNGEEGLRLPLGPCLGGPEDAQ